MGVGGFNLIETNTDSNLIDYLRKNRDSHPYTLDLIRKEILIFRSGKTIDISIDNLKAELLKLRTSVKYFIEIVTDIF